MLSCYIDDELTDHNLNSSRWSQGCGVSEHELAERVLLGHVLNPAVRLTVLLEHGCEKTHNDHYHHFISSEVEKAGGKFFAEAFGWFSVQLDGGIDNVTDKVEAFVESRLQSFPPLVRCPGHLQHLKLAIHCRGDPSQLPPAVARGIARTVLATVSAGGSVVMPSTSALLSCEAFKENIVGCSSDEDGLNPAVPALEPFVATMPYGGNLAGRMAGLHIMAVPAGSKHWVETLSGLGGAGVQAVLVLHTPGAPPSQAHPFLPTLQLATAVDGQLVKSKDFDLIINAADSAEDVGSHLLATVAKTVSREYVPILNQRGNTDFQISRGYTAVSL